MGNAITNPGRFIEKKILHEQFGMPDPKFPNNVPPGVIPQPCVTDWKGRQKLDSQMCVFNGYNPGVSGLNDINIAKCQGKVSASYRHCK